LIISGIEKHIRIVFLYNVFGTYPIKPKPTHYKKGINHISKSEFEKSKKKKFCMMKFNGYWISSCKSKTYQLYAPFNMALAWWDMYQTRCILDLECLNVYHVTVLNINKKKRRSVENRGIFGNAPGLCVGSIKLRKITQS
jgi:hypothetical protein